MKLKTDDIIFLIGGAVIVALVLAKVESAYVGTVATFFGGHKIGSIIDDKFCDRIQQGQAPPDV